MAQAPRRFRSKWWGKSVRLAVLALCAVVGTYLVLCVVMFLVRGLVFDHYTRQLEAWATAGGDATRVQTLVDSCGRLVVTQAGWLERLQLVTTNREELQFRVDVCSKIAANRVYIQPALEVAENVAMVCDDLRPRHELFPRLCRWGGLRPKP